MTIDWSVIPADIVALVWSDTGQCFGVHVPQGLSAKNTWMGGDYESADMAGMIVPSPTQIAFLSDSILEKLAQ